MKRLLLITLATVLLIGLIFTGCSQSAPSPAAGTSPAKTSTAASPSAPTTSSGVTEIRIGTIAALTGQAAAMGQGVVWGIKAALEDINAQGGVSVTELGKKLPVRLISSDDQSDPTKARTLSESLVVTDKVNFLVSELNPPETASVATVAEIYKIPFVLAAGPFEPYNAMRSSASPPWQYTWATGFAIGTPPPPGDFRAGQPGYRVMDAFQQIAAKFGPQTNKKLALFATDDSDGRSFYAAAPAFKQMGLDVIGFDKELGIAPLNTNDFTSMINQWKDNSAEMLWGNAPAPWFGTLWRQSHELGFKPKFVLAAKAALYNQDVAAWGSDLPNGICCQLWWYPTYQNSPGIGDTSPQSLFDRWVKNTGQALNQGIGQGYAVTQVLFDAIQRAGSLNNEKVNAALAQTDMYTINHRVLFDKDTHFSRMPVLFIQWQKTDKPWVWNPEVIISQFNFIPVTAQPVFPIPYK